MGSPRDEMVAIVDEENRVIGAAPRWTMRGQGLWHRTTYILVFDSTGRLYVQRRTMTKDVYPGYWDPCAGGVVLAGESYHAGALRELEEEMGIRGVELREEFDIRFEDGNARAWGRVFRCEWEGEPVPQPEEVEFVERMKLEEILERSAREPFTPDGLLVVQRYLAGADRFKRGEW